MDSWFIATYRLRPESCFRGLGYTLKASDFTFEFKSDLVWVVFNANTETWERRRDEGLDILRMFMSVLTLQVEYPFEIEPIQWIEDNPTGAPDTRNYILGRLPPSEPRARAEPPTLTTEEVAKRAPAYLQICAIEPYLRMAVLDYSLALKFTVEAIVFCARSLEWIEIYFETRDNLRRNLELSKKYVTTFFRIANDTTIARHANDLTKIRPPSIEEVRYCVYFTRIVLDRFAAYLWYKDSQRLPTPWPQGDKEPAALFTSGNPRLNSSLRRLLSGELA